jgi:hypothetical protein
VAFEGIRQSIGRGDVLIHGGKRFIRSLFARLSRIRALKIELYRAKWRLERTVVKLRSAEDRLNTIEASQQRERARRLSDTVLAQVMPLRLRAILAMDAEERLARRQIFRREQVATAMLAERTFFPQGRLQLKERR